MGLTGILDLLGESAAFQSTVRAMRDADGTPMPLSLTAPDAARGFLLAGLCRGLRRPMLVVTAKPEDADRISDELATVLGEDRDAPAVLRLPESEALPYERLAEDEAVAHDRLGVLSALLALEDGADGPGLLLVASVAALCQRTLRPDQFTGHHPHADGGPARSDRPPAGQVGGHGLRHGAHRRGPRHRQPSRRHPGRLPAQRSRARPHRVLRRRHRGHPHL